MKMPAVAGAFLLLAAWNARAAGVYAVWYTANPQVLSLPYVSGGQIQLQWSDLQTGPSTYTWGLLDSALAADVGQTVTVQVNGNTKPAYLFNVVPYTPNWGNVQVQDPKGVLMYWHPTYESAYMGFLSALAAHLDASPHRSGLLGLRMNFDAIGTEFLDVPTANQKAATWTVPNGVSNGPDWTKSLETNYETQVMTADLTGFGTSPSSIRVFMRYNMDSSILASQAAGQPSGFTYSSYLQNGQLYIFQTGASMEPAGGLAIFFTYALPGLTVGYAEPVSDSYGNHAGISDTLWCPPVQWNYWRLLSDLNMGVSDIAVYGDDLLIAYSGKYSGATLPDYQTQYDQAFRFAARYAGHHADPAEAPGAWIAFRQSTTAFTGHPTWAADYTRFITLLNPQETIGMDARKDGAPAPVIAKKTVAGENTIGPYNQRFGAWARSIPAGNTAELQFNQTFLNAVNSIGGAAVNVTYLDDIAGASFTTNFGTQSVTTKLGNSGLWQTITIPVTSKFAADAKGGHIAITSAGGAVTFHMVEVTKPAGAAGTGQGNRHRKRP
jgi:hypothetical protein